MKKKIILLSIALGIALLILIPSNIYASDITNYTKISINGKNINKNVIDKKENTYAIINKENTITIKSEEDIYGLYIIYEYSSKTGTLSSNGITINIGQLDYLGR